MLKIEPHEQDPDKLAEKARWALSRQIAFGLLDQRGLLPVLSLSPEWERFVRSYGDASDKTEKEEISEKLRRLANETRTPWWMPMSAASIRSSSCRANCAS
ncbi:hypothetical protein ACOJBO_02500 [Rhizobium beringeri]